MFKQLLKTFNAHYSWDYEKIESNIPGWETMEEWVHSDSSGMTGIKSLYLTSPIFGFSRYVSVETNYEDVTSLRWANDLETFGDEFLLEATN